MSQVTPKLPTTGVYGGLAAAGYINDGFATLNTCWLGSSAPSDAPNGIPAQGQFWIDTSTAGYNIVKRYDATSWVIETVIDTANHIALAPIGGGSATLASASTTNLGSKYEGFINITGTTTINSFGSSSLTGQAKIVKFGGALQLTYNGTSMILPGGANINTAAGDCAIMVPLGSGNWQCVAYMRADGSIVVQGPTGVTTSVASAATTNLAAAASHSVLITGTTTITSFGSSAGTAAPIYFIRFAAALTLTHNATSLIIPGGVSIATAAGDTGIVEYLGSGNWRVISYTRASGMPIFSTIRERITAARNYYVSTTGNDSNDGLTVGTPFLTVQRAIAVVRDTLDLNAFSVTINLAAGTYTGPVYAASPWTGANDQRNSVFITGAGATTIISVTSTDAIAAFYGGMLNVANMRIQTNTAGFCLSAYGGGAIQLGAGISFGAATGGGHFSAQSGGIIYCNSQAYTIAGGAIYHKIAAEGGRIYTFGCAVTLTGTPAFSGSYAYATQLGNLIAFSQTFTGTATGKRYDCTGVSSINVAGAAATYFPGSIAGTTATNGVYA